MSKGYAMSNRREQDSPCRSNVVVAEFEFDLCLAVAEAVFVSTNTIWTHFVHVGSPVVLQWLVQGFVEQDGIDHVDDWKELANWRQANVKELERV